MKHNSMFHYVSYVSWFFNRIKLSLKLQKVSQSTRHLVAWLCVWKHWSSSGPENQTRAFRGARRLQSDRTVVPFRSSVNMPPSDFWRIFEDHRSQPTNMLQVHIQRVKWRICMQMYSLSTECTKKKYSRSQQDVKTMQFVIRPSSGGRFCLLKTAQKMPCRAEQATQARGSPWASKSSAAICKEPASSFPPVRRKTARDWTSCRVTR